MSEFPAAHAQAYLAAIVQSSDDAIIGKDLNGVIRSCNAAAERLFGWSAPELIGKHVSILIPLERRFEEDEILRRIRAGERVDHFETVRVTKSGERLDISLTVSPVLAPSGEIIGASKIARDITERKRTAQALAAQKEWFRVTLASIGDAVIACDPEGRVNYMNATAEKLTGCPLAEAQGKPLGEVFRIVNEFTREPAENPAVKVLEHGRVIGLANHTVLVARDRSEWPIADSAAPIHDDAGAILGVVLVFHETLERRRQERALAEQRRWLERTLASIGDAVIATDPGGRIVFMNPVAEQLTGWKAADALDQTWGRVLRLVDEGTRRPVQSSLSRVLRGAAAPGPVQGKLLVSAECGELPIEEIATPIFDERDHVAGAVLVFRDISERRRNENERQAVAAEREDLLQSERGARAEAERASRVKDEFIAMVSHELRTPLNAILGWTEILKGQLTDPRGLRHGLEVVERNTRLQSQLISDLLDISRVASGKFTLDLKTLDVAAAVKASVETLRQSANSKQIELYAELRDEVELAADPVRIQQAICNLLSNAIKFTPEGGRVGVEMERSGACAEIRVRDTGVGIDPEMLPHLFERFWQDGTALTRRHGGLGLGLAIARHVVELHGGTIRAHSEGAGKGALFTITLPIRATSSDASSDRDKRREPSSSALEGLRVLFVDDDRDTCEIVRRVLEMHGAEVTTVPSATEALDAMDAARPDVIVSDIGLPEMSGFELLQRIRERRDGASRIPAIAVTAFARAQDRVRAMHAGFDLHLTKPVEPRELVLAISKVRERAR